MAYDPQRRNGWAKGLIHFHTDFSDGGPTVARAAEIARERGYDFLIVTDHLQNLPRQGRRFEEYIRDCDRASSADLLVIPGGEFEINWSRDADHSEAHTLSMSIRRLLGDLVWDPKVKPYAHWEDSTRQCGTILAVQEKLRSKGLPPAASHQFQHSYLGTSVHTDEHADYRYDLERIRGSRLLDFFYSGVVDVAHEPDDLALYLSCLAGAPQRLPAVYASCDYHYGPETLRELLAQHREEGIQAICQLITAWRSVFGWLLCRCIRLAPGLVVRFLEWKLPAILNQLKRFNILQFAAEQLSHTTYVHVGEALTEDAVLRGFLDGRTCVTRGDADLRDLRPVPSVAPVGVSRVEIRLDLPKTYSVHRPRNILIYRDGDLVDWLVAPDGEPAITRTWTDPSPPHGIHHYVVYVPSKFLSSPIVLDVG